MGRAVAGARNQWLVGGGQWLEKTTANSHGMVAANARSKLHSCGASLTGNASGRASLLAFRIGDHHSCPTAIRTRMVFGCCPSELHIVVTFRLSDGAKSCRTTCNYVGQGAVLHSGQLAVLVACFDGDGTGWAKPAILPSVGRNHSTLFRLPRYGSSPEVN